jgi:hypothetical protein
MRTLLQKVQDDDLSLVFAAQAGATSSSRQLMVEQLLKMKDSRFLLETLAPALLRDLLKKSRLPCSMEKDGPELLDDLARGDHGPQ